MEPSTLLPLDGLTEGYGLRDDALDQMLMTSEYREVTIQYRSAIRTIQEAFCSDKRLRIIAFPLNDDQDPLWPHMAWMPLWSNRDTCVLVADPLEPSSRHDLDYLIPQGFAQHAAHVTNGFPYYLPNTTPEMLWPQYLDCHPIRISPLHILNPKVPHQPDESEPTVFAITLEAILRLRGFIADNLLIDRSFSTGVAYQHATLLYELPLPEHPDAANSPWLLSFLLIDAARAAVTLGKTNYFTWTGLRSIIDRARCRISELDHLLGNIKPIRTFTKQFDQIHHCFTMLHPSIIRDPSDTNRFICELLAKADIFQEDR
ncbi:MAG: hypothetical protein ACFFBU_08325 [Promethearchaeota archaeon]